MCVGACNIINPWKVSMVLHSQLLNYKHKLVEILARPACPAGKRLDQHNLQTSIFFLFCDKYMVSILPT
jgi:hypothetical protein